MSSFRAPTEIEAAYRAIIDGHRFNTQTLHADQGWTLHCPELNLTSCGASFDDALDELIALAKTYVQLYLSRVDAYMLTDRAAHLPWVMRFALTPAHRYRDLFTEPPSAERVRGAGPVV